MLAAISMLLATALLSGCGAADRAESRDPVSKAALATATPTATAAASRGSRAKRGRRNAARVVRSGSSLIACDQNITVRASTTSCPFAQNVFYRFYTEADPWEPQNSVRAYSPVSGVDYAVACATDDAENVTCVAGDGGEVHFNLSAIRVYDDEQAEAYASTHDLGPSQGGSDTTPSVEDAGGETDSSSGEAKPPLDRRIPNYANGNGYPVECADGMWSKSGGIQGACSGHGGVR